jgi:hypothetical protein
MAHISFSTPFTKNFSHLDHTIGTTKTQLRANVLPSAQYNKRVIVVVQNQSATAKVKVIFNDTDTTGIILFPEQSISIENYNGFVYAVSDTASTPVHTATAVV